MLFIFLQVNFLAAPAPPFFIRGSGSGSQFFFRRLRLQGAKHTRRRLPSSGLLDLAKTKVSFSNIGSLSGSFPALEMLNLPSCGNVSDAGLMTFLGKTSEYLQLFLTPSFNADVNAIKASLKNIFQDNMKLTVCYFLFTNYFLALPLKMCFFKF